MCGQHGGLAPQVLHAAHTRIAMSAEDAAARLVEWMNDPNVDVRERLKAAESLLDRSGVSGVNKVLVGLVTEDTPAPPRRCRIAGHGVEHLGQTSDRSNGGDPHRRIRPLNRAESFHGHAATGVRSWSGRDPHVAIASGPRSGGETAQQASAGRSPYETPG